jgi:ubiquinone/menaquinone biosynthesis C-methylase UbiE
MTKKGFMVDLQERNKIYSYLQSLYKGVFDEDAINRHIDNHIDTRLAEVYVKNVLERLGPHKRILDIGSGFGSFVLLSKQKGLDAVGIEISEFEVNIAKKRLKLSFPDEDPKKYFYIGNAGNLPFEANCFDAVTFWNVLEHIEERDEVLSAVKRVIRPGGLVFILCPNYASFRFEAHYNVFWFPLLPRKIASLYLKLLGKDPAFFNQNIFYTTNWGVLRSLKKSGFRVLDPFERKISHIQNIKDQKIRKVLTFLNKLHLLWIVRFILILNFYNPLKTTISLHAVKQ